MNSTLDWAIKKAALNLQLDRQRVEEIYKSFWLFIRRHIAENDLPNISKEEFEVTDTNFNIPYIGKIYTGYDKIQKFHNKQNYYNNVKHQRNQTDRKPGSGN